MGLFDKFLNNEEKSTDNGVLGPNYLEEFTEHFNNPKDLHAHEWRRRVKSKSGEKEFRIKYFGELHPDYGNLIIDKNELPIMVYAECVNSNETILLFDGCKHGYNALLVFENSEEECINRPAKELIKENDGNEIFEIEISTYNGCNFAEEFRDEVNEKGLVELIDGSEADFETLQRNGFDTIQIVAINGSGKRIEIVSEETA